MITSDSTKTKEVVKYTYSPSGNRTKLEKSELSETSSDASNNQASQAKEEILETIGYSYNKSNQLVSETSSISGVTTYSYDSNGNLIKKESANSGDEELYTYEYSLDLRLTAVKKGGSLLMAASYDGDGNRVFTASRRFEAIDAYFQFHQSKDLRCFYDRLSHRQRCCKRHVFWFHSQYEC